HRRIPAGDEAAHAHVLGHPPPGRCRARSCLGRRRPHGRVLGDGPFALGHVRGRPPRARSRGTRRRLRGRGPLHGKRPDRRDQREDLRRDAESAEGPVMARLAALAFALLALAAEAQDAGLVEKAKKEGAVTLYTSMQLVDSGPLTQAFEKKYGIKV